MKQRMLITLIIEGSEQELENVRGEIIEQASFGLVSMQSNFIAHEKELQIVPVNRRNYKRKNGYME